MNRVLTTALMVASLLALTETASAETSGGEQQNFSSSERSAGRDFESWQLRRELFRKIARKVHKPKPIPIDPGRGDGPVPIEPQPQGPPGFVFVDGHWERAKAPAVPSVIVRDHRTPHGTVVVRDHRTPQGTVIVRDHRTPQGTVAVRDHRVEAPGGQWQPRPAAPVDVSSSPGGVTVTDSPRWPWKNQNVQIRDHRGKPAR